MNRYFPVLLLLMLPFGLFASPGEGLSEYEGTGQKAIEKLVPSPAQNDVSPYSKIEALFSVPLDSGHFKKKDVMLHWLFSLADDRADRKSLAPKKARYIDGTVKYDAAEHRITFTPLKPLEAGVYEVRIRNLKADKKHKDVKIGNVRYRFTVAKEKLQKITITPATVEAEEDSTVRFAAIGHYDGGVERNLTSHVTWSVGNFGTATVEANGTLRARREGTTTLKASFGNIESEAGVVVYKEINGYRLPPEPDPRVNNSTLLGIDSNNNGIRDDVERWLFEKFSKDIKYPKIKIAIALQWAEANQQMINNPTKESDYLLAKASACQWYWLEKVTEKISNIHEAIEFARKNEIYQDEFEDKIFNTKSRIIQRFKFLNAIDGSISSGLERSLINCNTNIDELGEMR